MRMVAATWPTSSLSMPRTVMRVGAGDPHLPTAHGHLDAARDGNGSASDSRHQPSPFPAMAASSPDKAEHLATHPALARLPIGHQALAGRQHGHAEATEHARQL